jgi:DNA-binding winged helix-turn-helix (wHTH) protein/tetratricopeptide (TPR) repeat protein
MLSRSTTTTARYRFGAFVLDPAKRELQHDGVTLALPARTFECLHYLIEHRDRAVGRDELVRAVFARANVSDAQLAQIVLRARRAIGDDGQEQRVIRTVPRFGFRWAVPATVIDDDSTTPSATIDTPTPSDAAPPSAPGVPADPAPSAAAEAPAQIPRKNPPASTLRRRTIAFGARLMMDGSAMLVAMLALSLSLLPWPVKFGLGGAQAQEGTSHAIIVLPMQVSGPDDATWARLGMMDLVVDRMRRANLPVLSSEATLNLLRLQEGKSDPQRLRRTTHAAWVVHGQVLNDKQQWQVVLTATDKSGAVRRGLANHPDLVSATRLAADRLLATIGSVRPAGNDDAPDLDERLQRAQSAILANDLDTARRILLEAPQPQRSAVQLEYRLAQIDFLAGRYLPGLATTNRLLGVDEARRHSALLRGQLLTLQGSLLMRLNRFPQAEHSFDQAVAALDSTLDANALGRALIGRGVAHSAQREFDAALADLGSARIQLLRTGDRLSVARVDGNLGTVEMERERPLQAIQYYEKAERDFEAMGAVTELNGIRFMVAAAHLQLLQPAAALAVNDRAWALRDQIRDPVQVADLILVRAEALTALGRLREARDLLQLPEAKPVAPGDFRRREYLVMDLARQSGDARSTALLAGAALKDWPVDRNPRLRAWVAFRQHEAALEADLPAPEDVMASLAGDALASKLGAALRDRRAGNAAAAESSYREAETLTENGGVPGPIANAVRAHARWLMQTGELDQATALVGRVAPWAEQDFEVALLQVELYSRLRQPRQWRAALDRAQRLAGERSIPAELSLPWPPGEPATASAIR